MEYETLFNNPDKFVTHVHFIFNEPYKLLQSLLNRLTQKDDEAKYLLVVHLMSVLQDMIDRRSDLNEKMVSSSAAAIGNRQINDDAKLSQLLARIPLGQRAGIAAELLLLACDYVDQNNLWPVLSMQQLPQQPQSSNLNQSEKQFSSIHRQLSPTASAQIPSRNVLKSSHGFQHSTSNSSNISNGPLNRNQQLNNEDWIERPSNEIPSINSSYQPNKIASYQKCNEAPSLEKINSVHSNASSATLPSTINKPLERRFFGTAPCGIEKGDIIDVQPQVIQWKLNRRGRGGWMGYEEEQKSARPSSPAMQMQKQQISSPMHQQIPTLQGQPQQQIPQPQCQAPLQQKQIPPPQYQAPLQQQQIPPPQYQAPLQQKQIPPPQYQAPLQQQQILQPQYQAPLQQQQIPSPQYQAPLQQQQIPPSAPQPFAYIKSSGGGDGGGDVKANLPRKTTRFPDDFDWLSVN